MGASEPIGISDLSPEEWVWGWREWMWALGHSPTPGQHWEMHLSSGLAELWLILQSETLYKAQVHTSAENSEWWGRNSIFKLVSVSFHRFTAGQSKGQKVPGDNQLVRMGNKYSVQKLHSGKYFCLFCFKLCIFWLLISQPLKGKRNLCFLEAFPVSTKTDQK